MYVAPGQKFSALQFLSWVITNKKGSITDNEVLLLMILVTRAYGGLTKGFAIVATLLAILCAALRPDNLLEAFCSVLFMEDEWPRGHNPSKSVLLHNFQRLLQPSFS